MDEAEPAEIPEWLQGLDAVEEPESEVPSEPPAVEMEEAEPAEIPDWLQELASEPHTAALDEGLDDADPTEVPDWLQELEPEAAEFDTPVTGLTEELAETEPVETPDWLRGLEEETKKTEPAALATSEELSEADTAEIPDWLQGLGEGPKPTQVVPPDEKEDAGPVEIPDWLGDLEEDIAVITPPSGVTGWLKNIDEEELDKMVIDYQPGELPDWLENIVSERKEEEIRADQSVKIPADEIETDETLGWVQGLDEVDPEPEMPVEIPSDDLVEMVKSEVVETDSAPDTAQPDFDFEDADAAMAWLEGLAAKQGISEDELISRPEDRPETLPGWLQEETETPVEGISAESPEEAPALFAEQPEAEELDKTPILEEPEPTTEPEMAIPDWLQEVDEPDASQPVDIEPVSETVSEDAAPTEEQLQPEIEFEDADAAMAWLEGLAAKQGISEDELISRPEDRPETLPGWLQEETETPVEGISAESPEEAPALFAEQPEAEELDKTPILEEPEPTTEPEMAIPDWLQEVDEPDASQPVDIEPVSETVSEDTAPTEEQLQPEIEFEDADAAMAWLEGLAAKQGVSEDELISRPEDRSEKPPDWVQQEVKPSIVDDAADIPDWLLPDSPVDEKQLDPEETTTSEKAVGFTIDPVAADFSEDIPEFLREIISEEATQDELDFETKEVEPEPLEPVTDTLQVETPSDEFPDWLKQADDEVDREDILEIAQEQPLEDIPEWFQESPEGEPEKIFDEMEEEEISVETIVEPGPEVAPTSIDEPLGSIVDEVESGTPPPTDEKTEPDHGLEFEPPGWVLTGEAPEDEEYQWLPTEPQELDPETGKLLDLNEASMIQLERLTPLGFRRAQAIIVHRDEHGPFESLSDLLSVPGIDQETLNALFSDLTVTPGPAPASIPEKPTPEQPVEIEAEDEDHAQQLEARLDLANGNLDQAIIKYEKLIQEGKYLDHIIADLDQALSTEFPKENYVDLLQALGDAYLKADRLQDALDTYTKAEELLR